MQVVDLLGQCTVKLSVPGQKWWGTGFFVYPGLILTCAHVAEKAKEEPLQVQWQDHQAWGKAIVASRREKYDLALLKVTSSNGPNPSCVYLSETVEIGDELVLFGYPPDEEYLDGCNTTVSSEGFTGKGQGLQLVKFKGGQVRPGMSGAPLLNLNTRKVCGMVKSTRARHIDLGGNAIPTRVILEEFPDLQKLQQEFHSRDRRWSSLLAQQQLDTSHKPALERDVGEQEDKKSVIKKVITGAFLVVAAAPIVLELFPEARPDTSLKFSKDIIFLIQKDGFPEMAIQEDIGSETSIQKDFPETGLYVNGKTVTRSMTKAEIVDSLGEAPRTYQNSENILIWPSSRDGGELEGAQLSITFDENELINNAFLEWDNSENSTAKVFWTDFQITLGRTTFQELFINFDESYLSGSCRIGADYSHSHIAWQHTVYIEQEGLAWMTFIAMTPYDGGLTDSVPPLSSLVIAGVSMSNALVSEGRLERNILGYTDEYSCTTLEKLQRQGGPL